MDYGKDENLVSAGQIIPNEALAVESNRRSNL